MLLHGLMLKWQANSMVGVDCAWAWHLLQCATGALCLVQAMIGASTLTTIVGTLQHFQFIAVAVCADSEVSVPQERSAGKPSDGPPLQARSLDVLLQVMIECGKIKSIVVRGCASDHRVTIAIRQIT